MEKKQQNVLSNKSYTIRNFLQIFTTHSIIRTKVWTHPNPINKMCEKSNNQRTLHCIRRTLHAQLVVLESRLENGAFQQRETVNCVRIERAKKSDWRGSASLAPSFWTWKAQPNECWTNGRRLLHAYLRISIFPYRFQHNTSRSILLNSVKNKQIMIVEQKSAVFSSTCDNKHFLNRVRHFYTKIQSNHPWLISKMIHFCWVRNISG